MERLQKIDEGLVELLAEVKGLHKLVQQERERRRLSIGLLALAFALLLLAFGGLGYLFNKQQDDQRQNFIASCDRSNTARTDIFLALDIFTDELIRGREDDPQIVERRLELDRKLSEALSHVNCEEVID